MKTDRILKLIQQKNVMRSGGALPLPKAQRGWRSGIVSPQDSVRNMAGNTMTWEFNRGHADGTGLSNYGNPALPYGATKEDAVNWYMQNIYPKLGEYSTAMEKASAGDFLYNSGKDLRGYAIQEYLKKKDPSNKTDWQDSSGNYKYRKDPTQWDTTWKEIQGLPVNDRRILLNKGRDWYYQNTNTNPDNTPSNAYFNTWYGRQHATDQYIPLTDRDVTNPSNKKFYPTRQQSGGDLTKAQTGRDQFLGPTVEKAKLMFPIPAPKLPLGLHPYVDFVDTRVMDPVVPGKVLEATRKHDILGVPREQLIKTVNQAREVGTDPATLAAIFAWETRLGETDPQLGHSRYHDTPTIEGLDEFSAQANIGAQSLRDQLEYGRKRYPKGPFYKQLQAYQGYGPLYPDTEKSYYKKENQAFFGIPVTKENPLRTNVVFPYGKTIEQYRDSVIIPTLEKYGIDYKQDGGQENLQYVPSPGSIYGNYYDPSTGEYMPQIYLKDVDIVADRKLPFQNGKFAPFLAARGITENDALSDPIAMAAAATAGGFGLGAYGVSQIPRMFARNVASEATAGLSDVLKGRLKNFDDLGDDLFDEDLFSKEIEATVKQMERDKLRSRLQDLSGRSKVPDQYMIDARGLAAKEPKLSSKDFYTSDEITANANQWREYWDARDKYDEMNPENPGSIIMSALTGDKSRMESFETLFPNAKLPNWREKFYHPEQLKGLRESLPYDDQFRWNDPLAPKGGLKSFQQKISSSKEVPGTVDDYLRRINDTWHLNDPRGYVSEMRGSAGLSLDDIKNLSDDELKSVAETIHSKMLKQHQERMMNDIFRSSSATPSLRGFRPGQMNKMGGLTKHQSKGVVNNERGSLNNMNVSDVWKQVTGSDWSQAKKLGLTDGSYEQNLALKAKLIAGAKQQPAERPKIGVAPKPAAQKPKYKVQMPGVQRDATATRPSDQQRAYEFYSKQPFGVTDPNSRIPQNVQAAMMQAATQPDAVYQTPTGVRSSLQSTYNELTRGTENDLVNVVTGAVGYPLQAGLNISNAITGDVPIRSDADILGLGLDALSLIPAVKGVSKLVRTTDPIRRSASNFLHPLTRDYRTGNVTQRFLADETAFPGLEVIKKGSRSNPKSITVKDVNEKNQYLRAVRNNDGSYRFEFDMSNVSPRRAGTAMQLLQNQFKPLTQFKETSTLSLDSYKNLLRRTADPTYSVAPAGRSTLNAQAVRNRFLDDIADPYYTNWDDYAAGNLNARTAAAMERWDDAGAPLYFSTKSAATEAANRINSKYFGQTGTGDALAMPIKGNNKKWTISLPNFQLTKMKRLGGSTKIRIKKRK